MHKSCLLMISYLSWALFIMGCSHLEIYTSDHGSCEFKVTDADRGSTYMTEIRHTRHHSETWYLEADNDPDRMFWMGYTMMDGRRCWAIHWTNFDEQEHHVCINKMWGFDLDPAVDRLVYVERQADIFHLKSVSYADLEAATNQVITADPDSTILHCSTTNNLYSLYVDRKHRHAFWQERVGTNRTLRSCELAAGPGARIEDHISTHTGQQFLTNTLWIAVDMVRTNLFWSQNVRGHDNDLIGVANYRDFSATNYTRWISNEVGGPHLASYPAELDVDYATERVFWVDMNMNWLATAGLPGTATGDSTNRSFRILDQYPGDQPAGGPSYHPTGVSVAWFPGLGSAAFEQGLALIVTNGNERARSEFDGITVPPYDPAAVIVDPVIVTNDFPNHTFPVPIP